MRVFRPLPAMVALTISLPTLAADHFEAPLAAADVEADLSDLYAWVNAEGELVVALAWGWRINNTITWDAGVLYGVHIDNDGDQVADHDIWMRFAQNEKGSWGVQVLGLPGADESVEGRVLATLEAGNGFKVWTGIADDPFFFDFEGFEDTLATGTLSFDPTRDTLAGSTVVAAVFTMDEAVASGGGTMNIWSTTGRLGE